MGPGQVKACPLVMAQIIAGARAPDSEARMPGDCPEPAHGLAADAVPQEGVPEPSSLGASGGGFELVDCQLVCQAAASGLKAMIEQNEADLASGPLPLVMGDGHQLIELFHHLLANALQCCTGARPRIRISARQRGEEWQISVSDNGVGMDAQSLDRLFGAFQRPRETGGGSETGGEGTGTGLVRCSQILERHGGRLWAVSSPGKGFTVHLTLPMVKPHSLPAIPFELTSAAASESKTGESA